MLKHGQQESIVRSVQEDLRKNANEIVKEGPVSFGLSCRLSSGLHRKVSSIPGLTGLL